MSKSVVVFIAGMVLTAVPGLPAQDPADVMHAPDGGTSQGVEGIVVPEIPGSPFVANASLEVTRQLMDGTSMVQKSTMVIARDNDGRVYREGRRIVSASSAQEPPVSAKILLDATKETSTVCVTVRRVCTIMSHKPLIQLIPAESGPSKDGKSYLAREDLGDETIDDLEVQHIRETRTYRVGAFGNDKPVVVVDDFWYSPQLQINLAIKRNDPRTSQQSIKVTDLNLSEPNPEQFNLPPGFKVVDGRSTSLEGSR